MKQDKQHFRFVNSELKTQLSCMHFSGIFYSIERWLDCNSEAVTDVILWNIETNMYVLVGVSLHSMLKAC